MLIFVTTKDEDRFVLYLKTSVCKVFYSNKELTFESARDKLETMKDFLLNFGVREVELREYENKFVLVIKDDLLMQLEDKNTIKGISVPVFTLL